MEAHKGVLPEPKISDKKDRFKERGKNKYYFL